MSRIVYAIIISIVKVQKEIFLIKYDFFVFVHSFVIGIEKMRPKWLLMASNKNYLSHGKLSRLPLSDYDCGGDL